MRCEGRRKFYRTNAEAIRPLHEWAGTFERYWMHQLLNVKKRAEAQMTQEKMSQLNSESGATNPSADAKEKP
jgi:hypothetical protein